MLQSDSRKIKFADTFIALKGYNEDGHKYIEEAIKKGASKIVCEHGSYSVKTIIVDNTNEYLNKYLKTNNIDIKIIGVTGTNGKTTTCYLIYQLLNNLGINCAYIGTIGYIYKDICEDLNNTTPGGLELYYLIKRSKEYGCKYIVMEVSSQALDQKRVDFLEFDYAIFTNLTRDHLDYHKNIDNYINSKKRLFELLKENGKSIINNDDKYSDNFKIYNYKTYGFKNSDYTINKDDYINGDKYNIPLLCDYNKYNILAAISLLYEMGYKYEDLYNLVSKLKEPSGRMEVINYNSNKIIIDYAHTPDALDNVLNGIKKYVKGRIITIVGCGGNRDKGKRSMMGEIATNLSNYVIFTSDNPRYEDPNKILSDITNLLYNKNYEIESNRENAIKKGIQLLDNNDILLVLGKGHEKYQIIKGKKYPFDDKEVILKNI